MNYLDLHGVDPPTPNISSGTTPTTTTAAAATATTSVNQQAKDLSDWRNIQLGTTPTMFERFWMPTTVNPWPTPTTPAYPSLYNPATPSAYPWVNSNNNNQSWPGTTYAANAALPMMNFNSPQTTLANDVIDLTTNNAVNPSTPIRFVFLYD